MTEFEEIAPEEGSRQKAIIKEYEDMAPTYSKGSEECGWSAPRTLVQKLSELGLIQADMEIVDFATGDGALAAAFRQTTQSGQSLHITATDLTPAMLEVCRKNNVADEIFQQDITKSWNFPESSKDIVAATGVAEYITHDELPKVIQGAAKTLKEGGTLAITFLPAAEGAPLSKPNEQQKHQLSYVAQLFRENGLELDVADEFDAYQADDGSTVRHILALGQKK